MNTEKSKIPDCWYAVFTKSRAEKRVHERLLENEVESYLPIVKTVRQWSDRKKKVELPLIPSYVFVKMPEKELRNILPIHGVVGILKYLRKPARIHDYEIDNLRILCNNHEDVETSNSVEVLKGDTVEVTNGPFMGLIATCEKDGKNHRVVVKIDALGSCFNVNIPLSFLRKIESKKENLKV